MTRDWGSWLMAWHSFGVLRGVKEPSSLPSGMQSFLSWADLVTKAERTDRGGRESPSTPGAHEPRGQFPSMSSVSLNRWTTANEPAESSMIGRVSAGMYFMHHAFWNWKKIHGRATSSESVPLMIDSKQKERNNPRSVRFSFFSIGDSANR